METFNLFSDLRVSHNDHYVDFLEFVMAYNKFRDESCGDFLVVSSPFPRRYSDDVIVECSDAISLSGIFTALSLCYYVLPSFQDSNSLLVVILAD